MKPSGRTIVGVDPGFASLGWCEAELVPHGIVVRRLGVIHTEPSTKKRNVLAADDNLRRTQEMVRSLHLCWRDDPADRRRCRALCCEAFSPPRNASSAVKLAFTWGALAALAWGWGVPVLQASPQAIRKGLCGRANPTEAAIEEEVLDQVAFCPEAQQQLRDVRKADRTHVFDAVAAAHHMRDAEMMKLLRQEA